MKTFKLTMQTKEVFKKLKKGEGLVMKQYETLVFMIMYLSCEFKKKSIKCTKFYLKGKC